jgi:hypothetical protein
MSAKPASKRYTSFIKTDHVLSNTQRARVELTPQGDRIRWRVQGKVCCNRMNHERAMRKSGTFHADIFESSLGGKNKLARFLKAGRKSNVVMTLGELGYDYCDCVR